MLTFPNSEKRIVDGEGEAFARSFWRQQYGFAKFLRGFLRAGADFRRL
jgi:hypothetical protein